MRTKLQPGETVALIVRKHWLVLVKPALFVAATVRNSPEPVLGYTCARSLRLADRGVRAASNSFGEVQSVRECSRKIHQDES